MGCCCLFDRRSWSPSPRSAPPQRARLTGSWGLPPPRQLGPPDPATAFGGNFVPEAPETPRASPRDPQRVPTTLALIELLQLLRAQRGLATGVRSDHGPLRVAIVVTAWDAEEDDNTPNEWLAQNAPDLGGLPLEQLRA
jgi:hypothetical protein